MFDDDENVVESGAYRHQPPAMTREKPLTNGAEQIFIALLNQRQQVAKFPFCIKLRGFPWPFPFLALNLQFTSALSTNTGDEKLTPYTS